MTEMTTVAGGETGRGSRGGAALLELAFLTRLRVLERPAADRALTAVVLLLLAGSRWLAFPASIWDRDEAIFTGALVDYDPAHNYPHPPFFPLWISLGRLLLAAFPGLEPDMPLRLLSAAFSVWLVLPLTALWSLLLPRRQALLAALLPCFLPLSWLLAGRAYSCTAATAMLVAAAALLLRSSPSRLEVLVGSLYLAGFLLTRPQWLLVGLALAIVTTARQSDLPRRVMPLGVPLLLGVTAIGLVARAVGGLPDLLAVVGRHGTYHFGALSRFSWYVGDLGLVQACGGAIWGALWLLLAGEGAVTLLAAPASRGPARHLLLTIVLPLLVILLLLENPNTLRYAVPFFPLTAGLVVAAIGRLLVAPRATAGTILGVIAILVAWAAPHLAEYRRVASPTVRALGELSTLARGQPVRVVADRQLAAFLDLERSLGRLDTAVTWDWQVHGDVLVATEPLAVAVWDVARPPWTASGGTRYLFACEDRWLRRFVSPRLLDVAMVVGATGAEGITLQQGAALEE